MWQKYKIKIYSKLPCNADDNQCSKWIIDEAKLVCDKKYIFVSSGYYEGYAEIVINNLFDAVIQLLYHNEKINDIHGSIQNGSSKGFLLIDLVDKKIIDVVLVNDDENNYQLWQWYY